MMNRKRRDQLFTMDEGLVQCIICGDNNGHSKSKESWIQCNICLGWSHEACTAYEGIGFYVCDTCNVL